MERDYRIVNIRNFATFLVVLGHACMLYYAHWGAIQVCHPACVELDALKHIIDLFQMPLFFSLSGFLFAWQCTRGRIEENFLRFAGKKLLRLMVPYYIFALLLLPVRILTDYCGAASLSAKQLMTQLIMMRGDGHLWFLPSLLFIFLIAYFTMRRTNQYCWLLLVLLALGVNCIPSMSNWGLLFHANLALKYLWYFLLGFWLHEQSNVCGRVKTGGRGGKLLIISIMCLSFSLRVFFAFSSCLSGVLAPWSQHLLLIVLTSLLIACLYRVIPDRAWLVGFSRWLDKNSMAIYLFHVPLIYLIFYYWGVWHPVLVVLVCLAVSYTIAPMLAWGLRKAHLAWMIGEKS